MDANKRNYSLDVFRGATIALMILVNNPGSWGSIFSPLEHSSWHGCTPTDLVFPFFLFAMGNSMIFVIPKLQQKGNLTFWKKILKRSILIFGIGVFLNWYPFFEWKNNELVFRLWNDGVGHGVRILGVLQRIALAYFFSSIIAYYFNTKKAFILSIVILILYWFIIKFFGGTDPYSITGYIGRFLDINMLGVEHMYQKENPIFDPEGLLATLPSISQVLFGYFIGDFIIKKDSISWFGKKLNQSTSGIQLSGIFAFGVLALVAAYIWQLDFPLNKKIWSSSFVLFTTGCAILCLAMLIWFIDILKLKHSYFYFFDVFGKNALFIYVFSGVFPLSLQLIRIKNSQGNGFLSPLGWFYEKVCTKLSSVPELNSFVFAVVFLVICWMVAFYLDKKRIYIKV